MAFPEHCLLPFAGPTQDEGAKNVNHGHELLLFSVVSWIIDDCFLYTALAVFIQQNLLLQKRAFR